MCIMPKFVSNKAIKLAQAKQLIEEGWCQNLFAIPQDTERFSYCVIGAMYATLEQHRGEVFDKMVDAFIEANGLPSSDYIICKTTNITSWNDDKARTKEEVLAAFDKAINYE